MAGFNYNGKSTNDIIGTPLILVSSESPGSAVGVQRSKLEGDITISRPITNEYGTTAEPLSFSYALMKKDFEPFTEAEQVAVERWLTSPKLSSELELFDCNESPYSYFGLFTNTEWIIGNGSYMLCNFTFQVNGSYAFKHEIVNQVNDGSSRSFNMIINCNSDELEEYVYPIITVRKISNSYPTAFTFDNRSDTYESFEIATEEMATFYIDCQYNIIKKYAEGVSQDIEYQSVRFKDVGLGQEMGNIYWPRLIPGVNNIRITGYVDITVEWYAPFKKVGGWLI